jgi:phosphate uptake regulator
MVVSEVRKLQKVGESTLSVSIPVQYVKELELHRGDNVMVSAESDGTLRVIPTDRAHKSTRASIKADAVDSEDSLAKLIIGCYMLGHDVIEVTSRKGIAPSFAERASMTIKRLKGLEIVVSSDNQILAQSFMDPTKFPVDSLIKRLQLLVVASLEKAIKALRGETPNVLNQVVRNQEEIDELYWLIVRQLLVAFKNKELSGKMGLESPLHTSGDRVSAKTVEEIGGVVVELTREIVNSTQSGIKKDERLLGKLEALGRKAQDSFETTMGCLLAPEMHVIEKSSALIAETLAVQRKMMLESMVMEDAYLREIVAYIGQMVRYCNIIIEIALNRLLRKTSKVCVIQEQ